MLSYDWRRKKCDIPTGALERRVELLEEEQRKLREELKTLRREAIAQIPVVDENGVQVYRAPMRSQLTLQELLKILEDMLDVRFEHVRIEQVDEKGAYGA